MPTSPYSSIDSPDPYATASVPDNSSLGGERKKLAPIRYKLPILLFVLTVGSIFFTRSYVPDKPWEIRDGVLYTASLLAILLTHEFGHYFFARRHGVNATLPHFIPMPLVTPFGTMGAVIVMRDRIKSKNALLDIGASGPLAGMVVAIPVILYGLAHSRIVAAAQPGTMQEGNSILYWLFKRIAVGRIQDGFDVEMSPMAFAGWTGLFVTMLNLLPVGQLDGGHVAYALLGPKQNTYSKIVRYSLLALVPINLVWRLAPGFHAGFTPVLRNAALTASMSWLCWFVVLTVLERMSGGGHPPTEAGELSTGRRVVAIGTLALFVLLFMPTQWMEY